MKISYLFNQPNYLTSRTAIEREQKQFIQIAFAVHLSAAISAERYRSDSVALKSAVLTLVYFYIIMIVHKCQQSAAQSCLKNNLLEVFPLTVGSGKTMTFENRRGKDQEIGKKVPQAYFMYVEDTFLPCDAVITRIFSKEMTHTDNSGDNEEQKAKRYYYHSDHLGSAQFVTDWKGRQYEHIEYTPYGELWIEEVAAGLDKLPFRFTGKELDEETGLYYYGARYLDPKYSRWLSGDPALGEYIPQAPIDDEAKKHNENLPGLGGVYNTVNLHVYHYAGNNPVKYVDPDGKQTKGADLNLFRKDSAHYRAALNFPNTPDKTFVVAGHGNSFGIFDHRNDPLGQHIMQSVDNAIKPEALAKMITENKMFNIKSKNNGKAPIIMLYACDVGSSNPDIADTVYAENLANALAKILGVDVEVRAPNGTLRVDEKGFFSVKKGNKIMSGSDMWIRFIGKAKVDMEINK